MAQPAAGRAGQRPLPADPRDEHVIDPGDVGLVPRIVLTDAERVEGEQVLGDEDRRVVLVPASGMAVKQWPHWRQLATALAGRGLVAGEPEVLDAWRGGPARLLPPLGLRGLAAVFAAVGGRGGMVVGGDTGPMRMAAAVGARTVGIFGPTAAARYGLGPHGRRPPGPARLPAPPADGDHRAGVLVGGRLPALAGRPCVHGRRDPGPRPGALPVPVLR